MDYLFEQLGPESFQQFCQALLVTEYPDLQAFPVAQPDGGRDAFSRGEIPLQSVVAQIKYKRADEQDNADWMIKALEGELEKIKTLHSRGVKKYLMLTNASGTAHLDTGRIDKAQAWLDKNSPIPGQVLWRDDIGRRLDDRNDLKLAYPALLTGNNALTLIYEAILAPKKKQLATTMRLFVAEQYRRDAEVKFRQVDLSNTLNALFVDVPVDLQSLIYGVDRFRPSRRDSVRLLNELRRSARTSYAYASPHYGGGFSQTAGAADVLLAAALQRIVPKIVLQGAPGQGKSTVAQYVCQVHRARLLGKAEFVNNMSEQHRAAPFRLPIKVDLRDLADFIDGREYMHHAPESSESNRTFERFLASLIAIQSGSDSFSINDLREVLAGGPSLIFLDGLDEVADSRSRERMLDRVSQGLNRLTEVGAELQVVITSRPAQLGQAAKLPDDFFRLDMAPLGPDVVRRYADKWTVAKGLDTSRTDEVKSILNTKLDLDHIRELTKNPMQLTILLTLILQVGHSLPDARTDLYRAYVDLFMTREAEKDAVVRRHKSLLLQIVEFLAWELQSQAEAVGDNGSISSADLRDLVSGYLQRAQRDTSILNELFERGLDRIYVLVQRVEGLYEFEVQPLREYFAAKYLYATAPMQSRWAQIVKGDRLQRFEAIAANPYWANVTRFYAGFWEQGEVLALSGSLREIIADGSTEEALNARSIGAALLTDRAFAAKPFVQNEAINAIFDEIGIHLSALSRLNDGGMLVLSKESGRDHLAAVIYRDYIVVKEQVLTAVCYLLRRNGGFGLEKQFGDWIRDAKGEERGRRIGVAAASGALDFYESDDLIELLHGDGCADEILLAARRRRLYAGLNSDAGNDPRIARPAFEDIKRFGGYSCYYVRNDVAALASHLNSPRPFELERNELAATLEDATSEKVLDFVEETTDFFSGGRDESAGTPVEMLVDAIGVCWASHRYALEFEDRLYGKRSLVPGDVESAPLSDKVGRARRWRGRSEWWDERLRSTEGVERRFWIAAALAWAPTAQIAKALPVLESAVGKLDREDVDAIEDVLASVELQRVVRNGNRRKPVSVSGAISERLGRFLVLGFGPAQVSALPRTVRRQAAFEEFVKQIRVRDEIEAFPGWSNVRSRSFRRWIDLLKENRGSARRIPNEAHSRLLSPSRLPKAVAEEVVRSATEFDAEVVAAAVGALQLAHRPEPVRARAVAEAWEF
jgi:hypothetical protein